MLEMSIETLKKEIVSRLKPLELQQITLFGSFAYGKPNEDSDIDLYVVTSDDFIPKSYAQSMSIRLKVANALEELQAIIPIDIVTHTKKMYEKFVEQNSSFSKEILQKGELLWGHH